MMASKRGRWCQTVLPGSVAACKTPSGVHKPYCVKFLSRAHLASWQELLQKVSSHHKGGTSESLCKTRAERRGRSKGGY